MIRVVMLAAPAGLADQQLMSEAGTDAYLAKPFSPVALLDAVRSVLWTELVT